MTGTAHNRPQTAEIDALLVWGRTLTEKEVEALRDAWVAAWAAESVLGTEWTREATDD